MGQGQRRADIRDDERGQLESWTACAALAAVTERIEIIAAIKPALFHPAVLAKMAARIEEISRGRFAINFVNAWYKPEFERTDIARATDEEAHAAHDAAMELARAWNCSCCSSSRPNPKSAVSRPRCVRG